MKQFPDFLKEFETDLQKYKLEYIEIQATVLKEGEILDLRQSKFLGKPYLPVGMDYPKDKSDKPLIMWAQLNFSEIPHLENYHENGILQFFVSSDNWYDSEEVKILFHENTNLQPQTDFSFLTEDLYEECPIGREHCLSFEKKEEYGGTEDFRFDYSFNGKDAWDFCETLKKPQKKEFEELFYHTGHKIGGYSYFTQQDPRDFGQKNENDISLLQIDSGDEIMLGDVGVANFFINKNALKNKDFEKAWFYWDCC